MQDWGGHSDNKKNCSICRHGDYKVQLKGDAKRLIKILDNQCEQGITNGDWSKEDYIIREKENGDVCIDIESSYVGFCFDKNGKFKGIYNWQE